MKKSQLVILIVCAMGIFSCSKELKKDQAETNKRITKPETDSVSLYLENLKAYKNSPHKIFVGFLVAGDDPYEAYNPANAPDSVDFLEFFAGRDSSRAHWRAAQAKGTRIVACHFLADAYFDGSVKDPITPGTAKTASNTSTYDHWASQMYQEHIVRDSLDGIDLDIEYGTIDNQKVTRYSYPNLLKSVAKYFGPNSTSPVTLSMGKKPVFFYDTDGTLDGKLIGDKSNYDYILFQAYTTGNNAWAWHQGTSDFGSIIENYSEDKLVYLVAGDAFKHSDGKEDVTGSDKKVTDALLSYATWAKNHTAGGIGAYRMSRDYNHKPPFIVSRQAIQIMNPAK
jgi:Glycoside hydrolase family 18, BT1044-like